MSTFKYNGTEPLEVPSLGIHIGAGDTFEVPDGYEARFVSDPEFAKSQVRNPDVTVDPSAIAPVEQSPAPVPAA